jgi:hypothetical protein
MSGTYLKKEIIRLKRLAVAYIRKRRCKMKRQQKGKTEAEIELYSGLATDK